MGYLEDMQKHMREAQLRWKKISKLAKKLEERLAQDKNIDSVSRQTAQIVLMIVEQYQPLESIPNAGGNFDVGRLRDIIHGVNDNAKK